MSGGLVGVGVDWT